MPRVIDLTGAPRLWREPELTAWRRAAIAALAETDPSLRAPARGDHLLVEQLAGLVRASPGQIVVTSGVRSSAGALMRPCEEVLVEQPTFLGVVRALRDSGLPVRAKPWDALVASARPRAGLWFTSPCRNPDGRCADAAFLDQIRHAAKDVRIVCNTTYRWYGPEAELPESTIRVGTLHKLAGRGARLGWVISAQPLVAAVPELARTAPPLHWQRTWGHFLAAGGHDLLQARHSQLASVRIAFLAALGLAGETGPAGEVMSGPNVLLPVPSTEREAITALNASGVRVSAGSAFGASEPSIRVCLTGLNCADAVAVAEAVAKVTNPSRPPTTML